MAVVRSMVMRKGGFDLPPWHTQRECKYDSPIISWAAIDLAVSTGNIESDESSLDTVMLQTAGSWTRQM